MQEKEDLRGKKGEEKGFSTREGEGNLEKAVETPRKACIVPPAEAIQFSNLSTTTPDSVLKKNRRCRNALKTTRERNTEGFL